MSFENEGAGCGSGDEGDDFRAACAERRRSKLGRTARLRGEVETVSIGALDPPALSDR